MNEDLIDSGNLQIVVQTEKEHLPLPNAVVRITNPKDGSLVEELKTDISGQTDVIELPAPPIEYSMTETDYRPYTTYHVTVFADGFERLHIGGVQLLPSSHAIQLCRVREATPEGFNVRNLLLTPHVLWGDYPAKIQEEEVKELPEATGQVVLAEPVIPEYIVVHLGNPEDSSVRNVWVPFRDYVKNVASNEIYSTWKKATIRANVLAILSFTLNRVYTEWYRGKGYEFTITNSTAFDQSYRDGGTVFEEISRTVDELFTTYITKEGIRQPLFTQYCDGRRTQCSGLSQWGSQALGEQGMDALSILRNYYGYEIYLSTAEKVEGIPVSYSGTELRRGSAGEDIRTIQSQLNAISTHYPAISKLRVDGIYGEATENAVRTFQKIVHLPQTGITDFATWYAISNLFVGTSRLA